jgi:rod shape determining protein RodA
MFKIDYKMKVKLIKQLDFKLIAIVLLILGFGLVMITSATHLNSGGSFAKIYKQLIAFVLGVGIVMIILCFDYNTIGKHYKALYLISLILLVSVLLPGLGLESRGASRWIKLGPITLQTSEIAKFTFIMSYAKILEGHRGKLNNLKEIVPVVMYAVPFLGLIIAQPDLGTALVFTCIVGAMLFVSGLNSKIIKRCIVIAVILSPLLYLIMADHQKVRIEAFLNPEDITLKGNYQVMQSLIAIGSGGITGKGIYNGTQNQENFLPINDSDFIFAVVGEELGAIGMLVLIGLYVLMLFRLIYISGEAKDFYGTLIVIGVFGMLFYQIVQNISMTIAVLPVTGITLPFVSAGASSVLTSLANIGLALNVYMRRKKINF